MGKNKEHKEVLEVPEKVGFGNRDCYIITETLENKITYIKQGKGDEEILWTIESIKQKDPEATIERGDMKISINLSRSFEVKTFKAPRQAVDMTDREKKRLKEVMESIVVSEIEREDYTDEDVEKKLSEFPKIIKYYTDDEEEEYYIKSENEIWIEEGFCTNNANLLLTLVQAYLKSKGIEKGTIEYAQRFEDVVYNYI